MAGWKIPELNGGFELGKSPTKMVHFPASHGADDTGGYLFHIFLGLFSTPSSRDSLTGVIYFGDGKMIQSLIPPSSLNTCRSQ